MEGCQDNTYHMWHCENQIGQRLKVFCRMAGRGPIHFILIFHLLLRLSALFFWSRNDFEPLCSRAAVNYLEKCFPMT